MSRQDPKAHYDGFQVLNRGVDSGNAPNIIGRQKLAWAVNATMRGGFPHTRPGWPKRDLTFENNGTQTNFEGGLFQGAGTYSPMQGSPYLVACIGGRIFALDPNSSYFVKDITGTVLNQLTPKTWMTQAEDFLIVQDGVSAAYIFDGAAPSRSGPNQVPTGTVVEYANGRLWVATNNGKNFVGSDLVGSSSGTPAYGRRDAVLSFIHNQFLATGGQFSVPTGAGPIRAMRAFANIDTSLGQGPLQVLTTKGGFSVNAPLDDNQWLSVTYPIQTVSLLGVGAESQEAAVLVNGDIWFRAPDGIRSYQLARRDFYVWANTPMSFEMERVLPFDAPSLLDHASAVLHDNRYLATCAPQQVYGRGIVWKGLAALDFTPVSGMGTAESNQPAWEGIWTGLDILQVVELEERCFAFVLSSGGVIELWEISSDSEGITADRSADVPIQCSIETSALNFEGGWQLYRLERGRLWLDQLIGNVTFTVTFKPDQYAGWVTWANCSESARTTVCPATCDTPLAPYAAQFRPYIMLGVPPDTCDPLTSRLLRLGYEYQVRIDWTGHCELKKFLLTAYEQEEDVNSACCPSTSTDSVGIQVCQNDFTYSAE